MVAYHEKHKASCTIAVRSVSLAEASRFGILNTNPDNTIYEFEEKPAKPKSTNASMGIYCFNWQVLRDALIADEEKTPIPPTTLARTSSPVSWPPVTK